jgi:hypothetical protein
VQEPARGRVQFERPAGLLAALLGGGLEQAFDVSGRLVEHDR